MNLVYFLVYFTNFNKCKIPLASGNFNIWLNSYIKRFGSYISMNGLKSVLSIPFCKYFCFLISIFFLSHLIAVTVITGACCRLQGAESMCSARATYPVWDPWMWSEWGVHESAARSHTTQGASTGTPVGVWRFRGLGPDSPGHWTP